MYVKEYLCKGCLEYKTKESYKSLGDEFCIDCGNEALIYCPSCDEHRDTECFERGANFCIDCVEEEVFEEEEEDEIWKTMEDIFKEKAKSCPTNHCIWIHDEDDEDYFFSPSIRFNPHAKCKNV